MDHWPKGSHDVKIDIPCICVGDYDLDEGEWIDYPSRHGYVLEHILEYDFRRLRQDSLGPFLQKWLFFGLLSTLLRVQVHSEDFIRVDATGRRYITTRKLTEYLAKWKDGVLQLSRLQKDDILRRNSLVLREASRLAAYILAYSGPTRLCPFPPVQKEIALSFCTLGLSLDGAIRAVLCPELHIQASDITGCARGTWSLGGGGFAETLESLGWCPYFLASQKLLSLDVQYYMASLGPPPAKGSHRRCSEERCRLLELDKKANLTKHKKDGCTCTLLKPDMNKIASIIRQGGIPILRYYQSAEPGDGYLEVFQFQPQMTYVALSHVWSDGLGNRDDNSLPRCQLDALQDNVNGIYCDNKGATQIGTRPQDSSSRGDGQAIHPGIAAETEPTQPLPVPFWIDTLCVPGVRSFAELNKPAIGDMTRIYRLADKVLIIDREVSLCDKFCDAREILIRVHMSSWMRRLWTLQEGLLAQAVFLRVRNGTRSLSQILWEEVPVTLGNKVRQRLVDEVGRFFQPAPHTGIFSVFEPDGPEHGVNEKTAIDVLRAISDRTTSRDSDEALCLAFLMRVNPTSVIVAEDPDKLPSLFRLMDSIPPNILFICGPRMKELSFRWAPVTFLGKHLQEHSYLQSHNFEIHGECDLNRVTGTLSPHGLVVMFPGLLLDAVGEGIKVNNVFLVDISNAPGDAKPKSNGKQCDFWMIMYSPDIDDPDWSALAPRLHQKTVIIIGSYGPAWQDTSVGVLCESKDKTLKGGGHLVRRICRVLVTAYPEYHEISWMKGPTKRICGSWQPVTQKWCVD